MRGAHIYNTLNTTRTKLPYSFLRYNYFKAMTLLDRNRKPLPYTNMLIVVFAVLLLLVLIVSVKLESSQQYSLLAKAFLHGQLNFLHPIGGAGQDPVYYHGKIFWSEGVFPALLLLPFVAVFSIFHVLFYQGYINWLIILGVWFLVFKLARATKYTKEDSALLAFAFTLSSAFVGVAVVSASWYFAQVITTFLLFWSLYEYFRPKPTRWWLIGIICGLVLLTRVTAAPIIIFFVLEGYKQNKQRSKHLVQLISPFVAGLVVIGLYNFLRFKSPFTGGYKGQLLYPTSLASEKQGLFSLVHWPSNLYSLLLGTPATVLKNYSTWTLKFPFIKNNVYGMSIFLTSPYFVYLFFRKPKDYTRQLVYLLVAGAISAILVLSYFGMGITQFGYRYSLDFLPELFVIFMIIYKKNNRSLSTGIKFLFLASSIFNLYLLLPWVL